MDGRIPLGAVAVALCIHTLWGGNVVAVKVGLAAFPPLWSGMIRLLLAVAILCLVCAVSGRRIWPYRAEWLPLMTIGGLFCVQLAAMNIGVDLSTGAMGSVLISTNPLFAALFVHFLVADDRLTGRKISGMVVAFTGTALVIVSAAGMDQLRFGAWGNVVLLFSATLLGLRLALSARVLPRIDEMRVAIWMMVVAAPLFAVGAFGFEEMDWTAVTWMPLGGILYQVMIATVAFTLNFALMKRFTPSVMMSFNFIAPIVGVLLSAWLLDEAITTALTVGLAMVAVGLVLTTSQLRRRAAG
jgi:O-acetylserine/cysteine efflux transporter